MTIVVSELYLKWIVFKESQIHPNETKLGAGEDKVNSIAFKEKQLFIMQAAEVISACVSFCANAGENRIACWANVG